MKAKHEESERIRQTQVELESRLAEQREINENNEKELSALRKQLEKRM
jgi:hypothetical protein